MRIAMVSAHSSPVATLGGKEAGGMNVYVRELSRELGRRGVAVDIFTRTQDEQAPMIVSLDAGVRVINVRAGPASPYDKNWLLEHLPEFVRHIRCFADGEDVSYDLIHSHYWLSGAAALELGHAWGVPVVHMFHTLGALKNHVARSAEERETLRRIEIERDIAAEADVLIAATTRDRDDMMRHTGASASHISVIPCGVDLMRFQPRDMITARTMLEIPQTPHRTVLLVGRIEPLKGIDALIEAIAILHERRPEWHETLQAVVVGGGNEAQQDEWNTEQQRLHALRVQRGVATAVHFAGAQPQGRLPLFYAAADIVTMPSHYESFGMAALEGLACGRPVVATSAGGPALIVEDGVSGLLTPPNDALALADRLEQLLDDDALRSTMGLAARERATRFGWSSIACEVLDVYRDLIAEHALALTIAE